jgi:hypothetical protein
MNYGESFQMPRQSFPTDVTSPAPTQLPGPQSESGSRTVPPVKPPRPDHAGEQDEEAEKRAAASYL